MTGKTYIVEEGPNPSTDYFVLPAFAQTSDSVIRCRWDELPTPGALINATVIFVRYVPTQWRKLIAATLITNQTASPKIIYFMDDDLFDTSITRGQTLRYRYKLAHLAAWQQNWLAKMHAEYWVSTPWLEQKYQHLHPKLVEPKPIKNPEQICRVFYHGSASHEDEIRWLHPIMQTVLKENSNIVFEIIGDTSVNKLYRSLPRVSVIHPMKWTAYQAFVSTPGRHIGLAPMLDNAFNQARSYTKFFDITRAGAAGIYAEHGPWASILTDKKNGLLIKADPTAWIETILQLAQDENLRTQIIEQAIITSQALENNQKESKHGNSTHGDPKQMHCRSKHE